MRILHVIDSLGVGGAEMLVLGLSQSAGTAGQDVRIYALRSGGLLEEDARKAGIPLHVGLKNSVYSPFQILRLANFLRTHRFDLIHVHLYPAQLWICLAVRLARLHTPVVTTEHSTTNRRRGIWLRWLDRWMYRRFAAIAAISEATRHALALHLGPASQAITVVPNGVDTTRFEPASTRRSAVGVNELVVLTIGSCTKVKDQATVIRAVASVARVRLILAGDGPLRGELEALADRLGVRSRVGFLGARRDIPEWIARADLYVQPSLSEGFCLAILEAMSGGLPCIVSRNPGLQEIVGQAGVYFAPGNHQELASILQELCSDSERRAALSERAVHRASRFTLQACSAGYQDLYRRVLRDEFARSAARATAPSVRFRQ